MSLDSVSAIDVIREQEQLEEEAARRYPFDFSECTLFKDLPERQALFACQTCRTRFGNRNAICYACSLTCHTGHELVELWSKRNFHCDCGTERLGVEARCKLRDGDTLERSENVNERYNHNFDGYFCSCNEKSEETASGTMYQCLLGEACGEDWFHARCIVGIDAQEEEQRALQLQGAASRQASTDTIREQESSRESTLNGSGDNDIDDDQGEESDPEEDDQEGDIFPELPEFAAYICPRCVAALSLEELLSNVGVCQWYESAEAGLGKRDRKPPHLFLKTGYQTAFIKVRIESPQLTVRSLLQKHPVLLKREHTYQPPMDEDTESLFLAGERALRQLPHEQVVSGIEAYSELRDRFSSFLRPFAQTGQVVTDQDINQFFSSL